MVSICLKIVRNETFQTLGHLTFNKRGPGACVTWCRMKRILLLFGRVHTKWIRWICVKLGRRSVRPTVQIRITSVTSINIIWSGRILRLVACLLKASWRLLQMRLDVAAGRVGVYRHRVGQKRRTVASKGAVLWWCCWSRRARTWGSPRERAHLSPIVRNLMQPGYVGSITAQVGEIQRLGRSKIQQRANIAGI